MRHEERNDGRLHLVNNRMSTAVTKLARLMETFSEFPIGYETEG